MKEILYYDYIVVDINSNFYEFTSDYDLTLGEISNKVGIGSETIAEVNKYEVPKSKFIFKKLGEN